MSKRSVLVSFAAFVLTIPGIADGREWVDSSGRFRIEAELVKVEGEKVSLRKADGEVIVVPIDRLSDADQKFVEKAAAPQPAAGPKAKPKVQWIVGENAVANALNQPTQFAFIDTPLADVIEFLANKHRVHMQVDFRSIYSIGLSSDAPITKKSAGGKLRIELKRLLEPLDLTYLIDHDLVIVTTFEEANAGYSLDTRVYRIQQPVDLTQLQGEIHTNIAPNPELFTSAVLMRHCSRIQLREC